MVTIENYEEYLMMQADGELSAQELASLQAFLDAHPELAAEAAAWQDLKLIPDQSIRYGHSELLLREERKAIAFRPWYVAVPAAAAILLAVFLLPHSDDQQHATPAGTLAHNTAPVTVTTENNDQSGPQQRTNAVPVPNPPVPVKVHPRPRRRLSSIGDVAATHSPESIPSLPSSRPEGIETHTAPDPQPERLAISPAIPVTEYAAASSGNRVHVQLAAANQEALESMKAGMDQRIEQIGRVARTVRETTVVLKLGGNAFNIHL